MPAGTELPLSLAVKIINAVALVTAVPTLRLTIAQQPVPGATRRLCQALESSIHRRGAGKW